MEQPKSLEFSECRDIGISKPLSEDHTPNKSGPPCQWSKVREPIRFKEFYGMDPVFSEPILRLSP